MSFEHNLCLLLTFIYSSQGNYFALKFLCDFEFGRRRAHDNYVLGLGSSPDQRDNSSDSGLSIIDTSLFKLYLMYLDLEKKS